MDAAAPLLIGSTMVSSPATCYWRLKTFIYVVAFNIFRVLLNQPARPRELLPYGISQQLTHIVRIGCLVLHRPLADCAGEAFRF
jgi:hypothetical protein